MANLIPSGNTLVNSADIVVTDVAAATVHGWGVGNWTAQIQIKNTDGSWSTLGGITSLQVAMTIYGPGTYRVQRPATGADITCGVDSN